MEEIQDIFLKIPSERKRWSNFLQDLNLRPPDVSYQFDDTIGIFDKMTGEILGTGSVKENVIQYIATYSKDGQKSTRFNKIVTELSNRLASQGIHHIMVFTKPEYKKSFGYLGFKVLVETNQAVLLEKGQPNIQDFLSRLPKLEGKKRASVVVNANPFTLGHRYLIEQAARENDQVLVFVVSAEGSLFKTEEREQLVREGVSDLKNVKVASGGKYMVSFATFPSYFIKEESDVIRYQTQLDARLFRSWIVPHFNLTSRYVGSEPLSATTEIYNQSLQKELSDKIEVKIIKRMENIEGEIISATVVRKAIVEGSLNSIKSLVPMATLKFIEKNLSELQRRGIKNGN